jgi:hypothetical protein
MQLRRKGQHNITRSGKRKLPAEACIEIENILAMLCEEHSRLDEIITSIERMLGVPANGGGMVSRKYP